LLLSSKLYQIKIPAFFISFFFNAKLPAHHCYYTTNLLSLSTKMNNPHSTLRSSQIFRSSTGRDRNNSPASLSSVIGSVIEELPHQSPSLD
jgi:hypothetical protein